jgi:hypothetical protein
MSHNIDLFIMFITINILIAYILLFSNYEVDMHTPQIRVKNTILNDTLNGIENKIKSNESFSLFCLQINRLRANNSIECDNLVNKHTEIYNSYTELFNLPINELRNYIIEKIISRYPNANITRTFRNCCTVYHVNY